MTEPKYVTLAHDGELYQIILLDVERRPVGHGYRGPTQRRAEQDLKYWIRTKGLERIEGEEPGAVG